MIQVFDTHRLPYRNAVIRAFKLNSDNVTEPAEFYNFTDYVKSDRDISKYAIGTEVYTNASGYICYGTDRQTVSCLGVNESVVVKVSLDGGLSWKIEWTLHGGDDTLTADDFGRLVYADGTVCFDPLQLGDTVLRDFVTTDDIDPNNRWEEDTIVVDTSSDSVTLTDWTRIVVVQIAHSSDTLNVYGHCRAGQCVEFVIKATPSSRHPDMTVKLVETNSTYSIPKGTRFRLIGRGDGSVELVRTGNVPIFHNKGLAQEPGLYSFGNKYVGDGRKLNIPYGGMDVMVANSSNDEGVVGVGDSNGNSICDVPVGQYLVTGDRIPLKPATTRYSIDATVSSGNSATVKIDIPTASGNHWLPDVLEVSVTVETSATLANRTDVQLTLPYNAEKWLNTTFVVKLAATSVPSGDNRTLRAILATSDLKYHLVGTATGTRNDVGDFSAVVASRVLSVGDGLLAHEQLDVTDGN